MATLTKFCICILVRDQHVVYFVVKKFEKSDLRLDDSAHFDVAAVAH